MKNLLMPTDPFRELDRVTEQVLGTSTRPAVMPMAGGGWTHRVQPTRWRPGGTIGCLLASALRRKVSRPSGSVTWIWTVGENREAGENPARARHCDREVLSDMPLGRWPGKAGRSVDPAARRPALRIAEPLVEPAEEKRRIHHVPSHAPSV